MSRFLYIAGGWRLLVGRGEIRLVRRPRAADASDGLLAAGLREGVGDEGVGVA
jgi:hypothetical protein